MGVIGKTSARAYVPRSSSSWEESHLASSLYRFAFTNTLPSVDLRPFILLTTGKTFNEKEIRCWIRNHPNVGHFQVSRYFAHTFSIVNGFKSMTILVILINIYFQNYLDIILKIMNSWHSYSVFGYWSIFLDGLTPTLSVFMIKKKQ